MLFLSRIPPRHHPNLEIYVKYILYKPQGALTRRHLFSEIKFRKSFPRIDLYHLQRRFYPFHCTNALF